MRQRQTPVLLGASSLSSLGVDVFVRHIVWYLIVVVYPGLILDYLWHQIYQELLKSAAL